MGVKGRDYRCTPWGNPTYNLFGWQRPCYLLQEGYAETFQELMETTEWGHYGHDRNDKCRDCMVHSGYEATAVDDTFGSARGFLATIRATLFGICSKNNRSYEDTVPASGSDSRDGSSEPAVPSDSFKELPVLSGLPAVKAAGESE